MKKRILIISDSVKRRTGYSTVARNIIERLLSTGNFEIAQLGFSDIPTVVGYPIHYYTQLKDHNACCKRGTLIEYVTPEDPQIKFLVPTVNGFEVPNHPSPDMCIKGQNLMQDHYGFDSSYFVIQHFKPDIVMPINDIWGLYNINHLRNRNCFKFVPYLAIDSDCLFPALMPPEARPGLPPIDSIRTIGSATKAVVFTNWAKDVINKTCRIVTGGKELTNIEIIPHGVDTRVWKPLEDEKKLELRQKYFSFGNEVFLIGCFLKDTPVLMADLTYKPIQDIKKGDKIINHLGEEDEVVSPDPKEYKGELITLDFVGGLNPITSTCEHPYFILRTKKKNSHSTVNSLIENGTFDWVNANKIEINDWICEPINKDIVDIKELDTNVIKLDTKYNKIQNKLVDKIIVDEEFMRFLGIFISEGSFQYSTSRGKKYEAGLYINLNSNEQDLITFVKNYCIKILGKEPNIRTTFRNTPDIGHVTIEINSVHLFRFMKTLLIGDKCGTKYLHPKLMKLPINKQRAFLQGWEEGDGCNTADGRMIVVTTCKEMAIQAGILYGRIGKVYSCKHDDYCNKLNSKHSKKYRLTTWINQENCNKLKIKDNFILRKITSIEVSDYIGKVYNFEVKNKNSYVVQSVGVHNSVARNQPRKRLDAVIMTIKRFIDKGYEKTGKKIMCYMHSSLNDAQIGWDLKWLSAYYGVSDRLIFDKNLQPGMGPSEEQLNEIVNCFDVHLLLPNSEGFCSFGDTRIITPDSIKYLKDLQKDDIIISHLGKEKKVIQPLSRNYKGRMIGFKYVGSSNTVWFTPNHRILVSNEYMEKDWIPSSLINRNHYLCFPKIQKQDISTKINIGNIIKKYSDYPFICKNNMIYGIKNEKENSKSKPIPEIIELTPDISEFLGNYLAEGSKGNNDIKISINSQADDIIRKNAYSFGNIFNLKISSFKMERNRENISIYSTTFRNFFAAFGKNAHEKTIPIELFNIFKNNPDLCKKLLNGMFEGDGYCSNKNGALYTTTSEKLAYQVKYLFLTLGIMSKIYCTIRKTNRNSFVVQLQNPKDFKKCQLFIDRCKNIDYIRKRKEDNKIVLEDNDYFYLPVRKIYSKEYDGLVYNVSVEDDESYITDGFAVHNCLPVIETAAAGIPNLVAKYSAHADWGKDALMFCKIGAYEHEPRTNFIKGIADTDHAAHQLNLLYSSKELRKDYSKKGIALGKKLDWSNIQPMWETLLNGIDVSDLKEDRYQNLEVLPERTPQENTNLTQFNLKYLPN
jgi:intein/homing endonuclease